MNYLILALMVLSVGCNDEVIDEVITTVAEEPVAEPSSTPEGLESDSVEAVSSVSEPTPEPTYATCEKFSGSVKLYSNLINTNFTNHEVSNKCAIRVTGCQQYVSLDLNDIPSDIAVGDFYIDQAHKITVTNPQWYNDSCFQQAEQICSLSLQYRIPATNDGRHFFYNRYRDYINLTCTQSNGRQLFFSAWRDYSGPEWQ